MNRWAIYIDIEGFSETWLRKEVEALKRLRALMDGIYQIGVSGCAGGRLFAHQIVDGFILVSEFGAARPENPVAIATVLMRLVLSVGGVAKCGVSDGEFGDITGCYPDIIRENLARGVVQMGQGLMTISPVMGTALVHAYTLTKKRKGAVLLLDPAKAEFLPNGVVATERHKDYVIIDWIHSKISVVDQICSKSHIELPSAEDLETRLRTYVGGFRESRMKLGKEDPREWADNTLNFNGCHCQ